MDPKVTPEQDAMVRTCVQRAMRELKLSGVEASELVAYGYEGLLQAKLRYDPARNPSFEAFAYHRVRGAILDGVREMAERTYKVHDAVRRLELMDSAMEDAGNEHAKSPSDNPDARAKARRLSRLVGVATTSHTLSSCKEIERAQTPEDVNNRALDGAKVRELAFALPEREKTLIVALYFEDRLMADVGEELGLSESGASRFHARTLELLKTKLADAAAAKMEAHHGR